MKKSILMLIFFAVIVMVGCNKGLPTASSLENSLSETRASVTTSDSTVAKNYSASEKILGQIKTIFFNGGRPQDVEELIVLLPKEEQGEWKNLKDRYLTCWNIPSEEEKYREALDILEKISLLVEKGQNEHYKGVSQSRIRQAETSKKQIESIWQSQGGTQDIESWLAQKNVNLGLYWKGATSNLGMAQDLYLKRYYVESATWAEWAIENFAFVVGAI